MAQDNDRDSVMGLLSAGRTIAIGAAVTGLRMAGNPPHGAARLIEEMRTLVSLPGGTGPEFGDKAKALAGLWMQKGLEYVSEFKDAGERFDREPTPSPRGTFDASRFDQGK